MGATSMPQDGKLERVEGCDVRRTGWKTGARRCPVHADALELCFDETDYASWSAGHQAPFNHDDNRVRWRCDTCVGSWLENHFLEEGALPVATRLILTCPRCASRRVTHECVPACCGSHKCIDCGAGFELAANIVEPGARKTAAATPGGKNVILSASTNIRSDCRSGWTRTFRRCPEHQSPLELVIIAIGDEPPELLAWHCKACQRTWTEPSFRHLRLKFAPDANPGAVCPQCQSEALTSVSTEGNIAKCQSCGSTISLVLEPVSARR